MNAACNVVYVDRAARQERMVRRGEAVAEAAQSRSQSRRGGGDGPFANAGAKKMERNVKTLLETFNQGALVVARPLDLCDES